MPTTCLFYFRKIPYNSGDAFDVWDARDGVPYENCVTRVRCRGDGPHRPRATEDGRPYNKINLRCAGRYGHRPLR
ncbi:MAG: hypothetical protein FWE47_01765, partial [Oscillospiraceae bacterium]|nr:hypothetical protein [Oscillospiraceae bacterium]